MNFLVDADTIFDFFNGKTELFPFFDEPENIYVSTVTLGELLSKNSSTNSDSDITKICQDFCHLLHLIPVDETIAIEYGKLKSTYPEISDNKLWLGATALCRDFVILSSDKELEQIIEIIVKNVKLNFHTNTDVEGTRIF